MNILIVHKVIIMSLIQKIGAEKVKHHLEIDIHYIRIKLSESCPVLIEIQRGRKMHQETQLMNYDMNTGFIQFDYPIGFDITMHKKGEKYVKKYFEIKFFEIHGKNKTNNGKIKIDFSQFSTIKKPIVRREVQLQGCSDKYAMICISVKLEPLSKSKNPSIISSPNPSVLASNYSALPKKTEETLEVKNSEESYSQIKKEKIPAQLKKVEPVPVLIPANELYNVEDPNDSVNSKMSFSDFIINPKDSEVASESSSSEEEVKTVPVERLVAHAMPKVSRDLVTPNENSKAAAITRSEEENGLSTKREGNRCVSCLTF